MWTGCDDFHMWTQNMAHRIMWNFHIFKCELNIFQCELLLIVTCEKQTGNFGQSCESNIFTLIYFLKCELWIWKCKKKKKRHMWTWKCKQVSIFSITWITMSTCESHTFTCDGLFPSGRRRPHKYINILQLYADQQAAMHVHISHASSGTLAFVFPSLSLSVTLSVLVVK